MVLEPGEAGDLPASRSQRRDFGGLKIMQDFHGQILNLLTFCVVAISNNINRLRLISAASCRILRFRREAMVFTHCHGVGQK
jgi:hypothetical protein